jgi:hypothetical protein
MAEVPELRQPWSIDDMENGRFLLSHDKKSLTLSSWIAQIYTAFCWDALFTDRNLDEAEHPLQQVLALLPSSYARYLRLPGIIRMPQGKPAQVSVPLDEAIGRPLDGIRYACGVFSVLSDHDRSGGRWESAEERGREG